ncbi:hypothetical protein [Umezawaea sp. Da 62-37]|uniref:hypothetical protein n=1 Tax=Umezawaea sp. Da 62-37 TaxID=3075927 RepID=UPI0028F6D7B5|nr:hypothetical protein [Umezawaea sp. Da 62-37]WNV84886.1 hypothetical protein RM788_43125 [Umezawaea sp. Da 62-37]
MVALVFVVGAVFLLSSDVADSGSSVAAAPSSTMPVSASLDPADAARLADEVVSGDERRVREVVALPSEQELDPAAIAGLAAMGPLAFDLGTFRDRGDGRAEVVARDGAQMRWLVGLLVVGGQWRIELAEPAS